MEPKSKFYNLPLAVLLLMPLCLLIDFFTLNSVTASWKSPSNKIQAVEKTLKQPSTETTDAVKAIEQSNSSLIEAKNILENTTYKKLVSYENVPILGFHDVVNTDDPNEIPPNRREFSIDCTKKNMEKLLEYLVENDYWFLSANEFYDYFLKHTKAIPSELKSKKPIMLTFDDGYIGVHRNLLPVLESIEAKYSKKVKVVLFINPSLMAVKDRDLEYVSCDDLKDGAGKGYFDVQSHGLTHQHMPELNVDELSFNMLQAKNILKQCLAETVAQQEVAKYLAYPYGETNKRVSSYASQNYLAAFIYDNRLFEMNSKYNHNYRISRLTIALDDKPEKLFQQLEANYKVKVIALNKPEEAPKPKVENIKKARHKIFSFF